MNKRARKIKQLIILACVFSGTGIWLACNRGFDRLLPKRDYTDTTSAIARNPKVLYIVIDGARGESVRDANPPNIMNLTQHAVYCWNGITDTLTLNTTSWADLLTGVRKEKHGVVSRNVDSSNLSTYPVFFQYIKERKPAGFQIASFCSNDTLGQQLITKTNSDINEVFNGNDEDVKNAVIKELGVDSAGLVFCEFSGVDQAGAQYGYDVSIPQYKAAILQVDNYIGAMMDALKKRKNYNTEQWMVVVTSDHGGPFPIDPTKDDHTIFSNPRVNNFTIFYAPGSQPSFIDKPFTGERYIGKGVELYGDPNNGNYANATITGNNSVFNFGSDGEFTIEMKVKVNPGPGTYGAYYYYYPSILAKRASFNSGVVGWCIFLEQNFWQINFGQAGQGNTQVKGSVISDGNWHDIAVVVVNRNGKRYARTYTDGNFNHEVEITGKGNINSPAPLTMGYLPGSIYVPADVFITDLKIWATALDDATISQYACNTTLSSDNPFNDYLLGYWPCTDGSGGYFVDQGSLGNNFQINGSYSWNNFNDLICAPPASNLASLVIEPVDVARQIMNWLQIVIDPNWEIGGRLWTNG